MDGRSQSLSDWCGEFGADYNRTYLRLQDGWSLAAALTEPKREGNGRVPRRYGYGGEHRTLEEWSKLFGIDTRRVRLRMRHGWPFEVALTTPLQPPQAGGRQPRLHELNGVRRTLKDWSALHDNDLARVRLRLSKGWTLERALTEPRHEKVDPRKVDLIRRARRERAARREDQSALTATPGVAGDSAETGRDRRGSVARDRG